LTSFDQNDVRNQKTENDLFQGLDLSKRTSTMDRNFLMTNMISGLIAQRFKIEPMYALTIASMVGSYTSYITFDKLQHWVDPWTVKMVTSALVLGLTYYWYYYLRPKPKVDSTKYNHLSLYSHRKIVVFTEFMEEHPDFFSVPNLEYGNQQYRETCDLFFPENDSEIKIKDTLHNVEGVLRVKSVTNEEEEGEGREKKTKTAKYRYLQVELPAAGITPLAYFRKLQEHRENKYRDCPTMRLCFVKVTPDRDGCLRNNTVQIYKGPKDNHAERYKKYMGSYFSALRNQIWKRVSKVHFHPEMFQNMGQTAGCNILLYGPPGTGKSTLAYRLAVATGRHLVSVNLLDYLSSKRKLYRLLLEPYIWDDHCKPSEVIILVEEFDKTVRVLKEQDDAPLWANWFKNTKSSINTTVVSSRQRTDSDSDEEEEKKEDKKAKSSKPDKLKAGNSKELKLADLLDILQGSVPIEGSIIVATTNHYEYIRKTLPALVRPGRLTPMHVDYLDWDSLKELVLFYFGEKLTLRPMKIEYPTSGIIEMAMECQDLPQPLESFEKRLMEHCSLHE
jgi:hypothetical protein